MKRKGVWICFGFLVAFCTACPSPEGLAIDRTISMLSIPGVSAPVIGAMPATSIDTAQYTGTIAWDPNPGSAFAADTVYTAAIVLTAKPGWTLAGVSANTFAVSGGTVTHDADSGVVGVIFPTTGQSITQLAITGVIAPVAGAIPVVDSIDAAQYSGTVTWSPNDGLFAGNVAYTATITLAAKPGWSLGGVPANGFTVAGASATNAANSGVVTAEFPETGPATVTLFTITGVTAPVRGATPDTTPIDTAQYSGTVSWLPAAGTFAPGTVYVAEIVLTAKHGWTLNGVSANAFAVSGATATNPANSGTVSASFPATGYAIGDTGPGGGIVFYDAGSAQSWGRYLEAAPSGWNGGADPTAQWKTTRTATDGVAMGIGTGWANTYTYMTGATHPAAAVCRACTYGGKGDWYLPSRDELSQLYAQRALVGGFSADRYWSSSVYSAVSGMFQRFNDGFQDGAFKDFAFCVRPIRAFF